MASRIVDLTKKITRNKKPEPEFVKMPEYQNFIEKYNRFQEVEAVLANIRGDIRDVRKEYEELRSEQRQRQLKNEPLIDPMEFQRRVTSFDNKLNDLRKTETECSEVYDSEHSKFLESFKEFARAYDERYIHKLIEKRESVISELQDIDGKLFDAFKNFNSKKVVIDGLNLPVIEFSKKIIHILELSGYERWKQNIE